MHAIQELGPLLTEGRHGTLKAVVRKWLQGGAPQDEVEAQYGPISDWNAPRVSFRYVLGLTGEWGFTDQQIATLLEGITYA